MDKTLFLMSTFRKKSFNSRFKMTEIQLNLPFKHARFVLQAIDFRLETWKKSVESGELDEDEISDINNDSRLLQGVRDELEMKLAAHRDHILKQSSFSR